MEQLFITWLLIFIRAGAMLYVFPIFSATAVPVRLRVGLAAVMGLFILPGVFAPPNVTSYTLVGMVLLIGKEVLLGLILGYLCRLVLFSMALAGHYIGTELGLQLSSTIAPGETQPVQVPGVLMQLLAVMLILALDIHHLLLAGFQQSYNVLPIGAGQLSNALFDTMLEKTAWTFVIAVKIAAPMIAVSIVINLLMMVLGRAVPQMNVFMEAFGVRILVGIFLMGFIFNMAAHEISAYVRRLPDDFTQVIRLLGMGG
tara:strand:- start:1518 stop:2288 length:771 start_codon:yes stop_codon:yes gene_type:complete